MLVPMAVTVSFKGIMFFVVDDALHPTCQQPLLNTTM